MRWCLEHMRWYVTRYGIGGSRRSRSGLSGLRRTSWRSGHCCNSIMARLLGFERCSCTILYGLISKSSEICIELTLGADKGDAALNQGDLSRRRTKFAGFPTRERQGQNPENLVHRLAGYGSAPSYSDAEDETLQTLRRIASRLSQTPIKVSRQATGAKRQGLA